ncbi:MAG: alpha/beta fold hydrolase [Polyangiaceae bacterium]
MRVLLALLLGYAAFALGALVYLRVSYWAMSSHVERRSWLDTAKSLFFEWLCALWVQPLLPLYFLLGYRLGPRPARTGTRAPRPIVCVHGYGQNRVDFIWLARRFAEAGLGPCFGINYSFLSSVRDSSQRLEAFCKRVLEETGAPQVDLVCHSLGGLVAMDLAARSPELVGRIVTIGSPHAGVLFRGPILGASGKDLRAGSELLKNHATLKAGVPVLSIYSSHDNVVHPKSTSSLSGRGGEDIEVPHLGHFGLLFSRSVADPSIAFLKRDLAA